MLLNTVNSILTMHGPTIDSRRLTLYCRFSELSPDSAEKMAVYTQQWVQEMFLQKAVACWYLGEKSGSLRNLKKYIEQASCSNKMISWNVNALIRSEYVDNKKECAKACRALALGASSCTSDDFGEYWHSVFPEATSDNDSIVRGIHKIFREDGHTPQAKPYLPDICSMFFAMPSMEDAQKWHGEFGVSICAAGLEESTDCIAEEMLAFLMRLAEVHEDAIGHVMLQPLQAQLGTSPYMTYFGQYYLGPQLPDGSHKASQYVYHALYLPGVEWANLISPSMHEKLRKSHVYLASNDLITIKLLSSGGMVVRSNKRIRSYGVTDAVALKRFLLPVLFPGGSHRSLRNVFLDEEHPYFLKQWPRSDWAIVPILEDELLIVGRDLVFRSKSVDVI